MKTTKPTRKRSIPHQSKKRSVEAVIYRQRKKVFLEAHPVCFVCGEWFPMERRDLHHVRGRAGKLYLDERFWEMACNGPKGCHDMIHRNRKWAIANEYLGGGGEWGYCPPL